MTLLILEKKGKGLTDMPMPLKEGTHILVERKLFHPGYAMPFMEMATDHYSIGYSISGDRTIITPLGTYSYHSGMVAATAPFQYHRTVARSDVPYERILIKFTPEFISPFIEAVGLQIFEDIYEQKAFAFTAQGRQKVENLFVDIAEEFAKNRPCGEFILQGMLSRILITVWEEKILTEAENAVKTPLTPPIMDALYYIEKHYSQNPSLEEAARIANFSPAYFSRLFHAQLGKSYSEYLNNVKLHHVSILLTKTDKSIMEIAQETGFCHGNYLNEQFKKRMGMTPGQFRKRA